jgi:hypothetical protein
MAKRQIDGAALVWANHALAVVVFARTRRISKSIARIVRLVGQALNSDAAVERRLAEVAVEVSAQNSVVHATRLNDVAAGTLDRRSKPTGEILRGIPHQANEHQIHSNQVRIERRGPALHGVARRCRINV